MNAKAKGKAKEFSALLLAAVLGGAVARLIPGAEVAHAEGGGGTAKVVEAEKFVLKAPNGKPRAELGTRSDGTITYFQFMGGDGNKNRMSLLAVEDGLISFTLYDKSEKSVFIAPREE